MSIFSRFCVAASLVLGLAACAGLNLGQSSPRPAAYLVFFQPGSADLDQDARAVVSRAARDAAAVRPSVVRITGYTDKAGKASDNLTLAERRTQTVAETLLADGVSLDRIRREPVGEAVATDVGLDATQDRRVEITFADQ